MELNGTLSGQQINILSKVYIALLIPSVIGSFSVLVVSIVRWRRLNEQVHLLVQLSLADLLAAVILLCTSIINKIPSNYSVLLCQFSLPLSLTFYFVSFSLVVVYAWKSKKVFQGWRERPVDDEQRQRQCVTKIDSSYVFALVWLIPMAIYFAYVLTPFFKAALFIPMSTRVVLLPEKISYCTSCILFLHVWRDSCSDDERIHDIFIQAFLFIIVIPVMITCSVIYYKVSKWYATREQARLFPVEGFQHSQTTYRVVFATTRNRVLVILFCWTPALLLILLSTLMIGISTIKQNSLFWLYIIQASTVSLQGFLNSMVYAWRRPNFRAAVLGENSPLVTHRNIAFFDESLRSSF
ncbi:transmembrane protein 116 [Gouania willdenowi]|uniref:Transmembrane protein 116-like n=1 Tax=Gouania willdenowi TaxID=441366 RepID=A0A8C5H426_GOUWI|nr:transmembrane protein 116-like [Gouania willdenowi]